MSVVDYIRVHQNSL